MPTGIQVLKESANDNCSRGIWQSTPCPDFSMEISAVKPSEQYPGVSDSTQSPPAQRWLGDLLEGDEARKRPLRVGAMARGLGASARARGGSLASRQAGGLVCLGRFEAEGHVTQCPLEGSNLTLDMRQVLCFSA